MSHTFSRLNAEQFTLEQINAKTGFLFNQMYMGPSQGPYRCPEHLESLRPHLEIKGLYMWGISFKTDGPVFWTYAGRSFSDDFIYKRLKDEIYPSQNEHKKTKGVPDPIENGPTAIWNHCIVPFYWYIAVCEMNDLINKMEHIQIEKNLLSQFDFIANKIHNDKRRLECLDTLFMQSQSPEANQLPLPPGVWIEDIKQQKNIIGDCWSVSELYLMVM